MQNNYANAKAGLEKLIQFKNEQEKEGRLNEAETRVHLVDKILTEVLDWPNDIQSIRRERPIENAGNPKVFYDYSLRTKDSLSKAILEAKKGGVYFEIDKIQKNTNGRIFLADQFKTSGKRGNEKFYEAMTQAVSYARQEACTYAFVSNGHQFAALMALAKRGRGEEYGKVLIYQSLEDILESLQEFREYFSYESLSETYPRLSQDLAEEGGLIPPQDILKNQIKPYPRNAPTPDLDQESQDLIEDLKNQAGYIIGSIDKFAKKAEKMDEFIQECYVERRYVPSDFDDGGIQKNKAFTEEFKEIAKIAKMKPVANSKGITKGLLQGSPEPIVVIGNIGVGKSIFIDYLILKESSFNSTNQYITKIDFLNISTESLSDMKLAVAQDIISALTRQGYDPVSAGILKNTYAKEIAETKKIYGNQNESELDRIIGDLLSDKLKNPLQLIQDTIKKMKGDPRVKRVVVFLDNVDQLPKEIQRDIYYFSREMMDRWQIGLCVIAMTPIAYYTSFEKDRSPHSTGHKLIYEIQAPSTAEVIQKRLRFAQKLIKEGRLANYGLSYTPDAENDNLSGIFTKISEGLTLKELTGKLVVSLAGDNVRNAINIVTKFVDSVHSILLKIGKGKRAITLPVKYNNFLRSILKDAYADYDESNEHICNIFRVTIKDPKEHFLNIGILNHLRLSSASHGYVNLEDLLLNCAKNGFDEMQTLNSILYLEKNTLIEPVDLNRHESIQNLASKYRITSRGRYHLEFLCKDPSYVEEMLKVTPIFDKGFRPNADTLNSLTSIQNAQKFQRYLAKIFEQADFPGANFVPDDFLPRLQMAIDSKMKDIESNTGTGSGIKVSNFRLELKAKNQLAKK